MRLREMSHRTEASYLHHIVDFIRFHGKRHARELWVGEIRPYLSYQATGKDGAASTQNMALSASIETKFGELREGEVRYGPDQDGPGPPDRKQE
jgi:hypothetical protein